MPTPQINPKLHAEVAECLRSGMSHRQIQKQTGLSLGAISALRHRTPTPMPQANKKVGDFNWREWVPAMQTMQSLKKKSSYAQDEATIQLGDGSGAVAIAAFSDQHMGAWSTNYDDLLRITDEFLSIPNLYIGLLGDYGHYAIKLRSVLEVADNLLPPEQQTDFLESWFEEIWEKVAFATWENHGIERQEKQAGESSTKRILSRKVTYFNGIGHITLKVGDQIYKGAVSHRFRGTSIENPCHAQMRYMRREGIECEFAMQGDTHTPGMMKYTDGPKTRVALNTGSIQNNSGYAKRYFSLKTHPVYPILVFHADHHEITPYWSVAEWLAAKK
jgi:hypothetical protein